MGTDTKQTPPNQAGHRPEKPTQTGPNHPGDQGDTTKQPAGKQPDRNADVSGKSQKR